VGRRSLALALVAGPLLYWQWVAPVRDLEDAIGDPSTEASYYEPLLAELDSLAGRRPVRVHVPPTRDRWEAVHVAEHRPLARGWLRQLESDDFELFQHGNLTAAAYRGWLDDRGVSFVALSRTAQLDYLAKDEAALIQSGLDYLRLAWSNADWLLYELDRSPGLVRGSGARLTALGPDWFELDVSRPGSYLVRIHHTPYWEIAGGEGCVERDGDWTRVEALAAGAVRLEAALSVDGLLRRDRACSG
jgi:hypothetical protein